MGLNPGPGEPHSAHFVCLFLTHSVQFMELFPNELMV